MKCKNEGKLFQEQSAKKQVFLGPYMAPCILYVAKTLEGKEIENDDKNAGTNYPE